MTTNEFLRKVSDTIAAVGHRGNNHFISAVEIANQTLRVGFSADVEKTQALRVLEQLIDGSAEFNEAHPWYDTNADNAYCGLIQDARSITS